MVITTTFNNLYSEMGIWSIIVLAAAAILFFIQFVYYVFRYSPFLRNKSLSENGEDSQANPLSVITIMHDTDYFYIENILPSILSQSHPEFEVVIVDLSDDVDFSEALKLEGMRNTRLNITHFKNNPLFPISNKMALNMAIKAARYDNIIITTTDSKPVSPDWLSEMAKGFDRAGIVLGYANVERKKAKGNTIIRLNNVETAMRWINSALRGKSYRGTIHNIGLRRELYFENNGFNHLSLNIGEDDLFIQSIVQKSSTTVVTHPDAIVERTQWGDADWWSRERLLKSNAFRFYPSRVKNYIKWELWSRFLFFAAIATVIVMFPCDIKILAAALLLLRFLVVLIQTLSTALRLGTKGVWAMILPYDLLSPFYEALICCKRRFKKTSGLWR